ncbi:MAG: UDP-N-acetylmuramate dehydrogenase [Pseudonocardiales bacterium]|nr:UDP-N-acetylmuramate dehydrogenase [Pseudonocardiales bacterium]MDT7622259.1 UDP-N-acetylmuramate dehydrogenase [Pseudonocardiales bacterium]MDT7638794.1 UDP-N-acetylmuramate dehydrogenase [Pseudonocardiales bacterium]MDT7669734.1 UDP-N-acetylmuramate dehydrogenase [Pseudonocardiales bacterium]MDT7675266.1 UDP-N-acetylmuramate dehydrogenase [Pseudonocardiales bacterium]
MSTYAPIRLAVPLAELTTLRLGGPAQRLVRADSAEAVVDAVRAAAAAGEPLLVLGGGSNLVVADAGVPGTTVWVANTGCSVERGPDGTALLTVAAGEDWDGVVAGALADGLAGLECLSGIPGRAGAVPVQNVGAYGVEIAELLVDVDLYDRRSGLVREHVPAGELRLVYRGSALKGRDDAVVLRIRLALSVGPLSAPIRYAELAGALGVSLGERVPAAQVRAAVLALRRSKAMVLDAADHDTWSAGSFFTNPVLSAADADRVAAAAGGDGAMPRYPAPDGQVKLSAAWLISQAGFERGRPGAGGRVALSSRHSLALTNRGGGTTEELLALAREVRDGVRDTFGVWLTPEPVLVGCSL